MMKTLCTVTAVLTILLLPVPPASAVKPAAWTHTSSTDFHKGETHGTVISSRGTLRLGPEVTEILEQNDEVDVVNALAATAEGVVFAGTAPNGIIYKIQDDKAEPFATLKDAHVFSLLFTDTGHLLAGTGGSSARIHKIGGNGKASLFAELDDARYVWAMVRGFDGTIYAATGPKGTLYRISADGKVDVLCKIKQKNLLCLAIDKGGLLYAGTDTDGLVYRVDPKDGKRFVLFDAPEKEISGITLDDEGNVYFSTADASAAKPGRGATSTPAGKPALPETRPTTQPAKPGRGAANTPAGKPAQPETRPTTQPAKRAAVTPHKRIVGKLIKPSGKPSGKSSTSSKGNGVYRIDTDGFVTEIFRRPVIIFSLSFHENALYLGTGNEGRIFKVLPEEEEILSLARLEAKQAVTTLVLPDGRLIVGTAGKASVVRLSVENRKTGRYDSPVLDAAQVTLWGRAEWEAQAPGGTGITLATRSGNVADKDSEAWDDWSPEIASADGAQIGSPNARFLQYRLTLTTNDSSQTPTLDSVKIYRMANNRPPVVKSIDFVPLRTLGSKAAAILQGKEKTVRTQRSDYWIVRWEAQDPNGDKLLHDLYFRQVGDKRWIRFAKDLPKGPKLWNTNTVSDGRYELKVVARDDSDNTPETELAGSRISRELIADNTPPTITVKTDRKTGKDRHRIEAEVTDVLSKIVSVRYNLNSSTDWTYVRPRDDIYDATTESVAFEAVDLEIGENRIALRAEDDHGNVAYHTMTIEVAPE